MRERITVMAALDFEGVEIAHNSNTPGVLLEQMRGGEPCRLSDPTVQYTQ